MLISAAFTRQGLASEACFDVGEADPNLSRFENLQELRGAFEAAYGNLIEWQNLPKKSVRCVVDYPPEAAIEEHQARRHLLERFGENCALTGPTPPAALEAAHLYSYASVGKHHLHGGLLLRRDVHRLFDRGDLAIHPDRLSIDADPSLRTYKNYSPLHGRGLHVEVEPQHRAWIERHWIRHRVGASRTLLGGTRSRG